MADTFSIMTPDPLFEPPGPLLVNGFRFERVITPDADQPPAVQRLQIDHARLADHLAMLNSFMATDDFYALPEEQQGLMIEQHTHMEGLLSVMGQLLAVSAA